jgi:parvulin-like peptidyl-prolyl isomerase
MRHIYTVLGLILIIAGIAGVTLLKVGPPSSEEALRVNGRIITKAEFGKAYDEKAATCPVPPEKRQFVDDLVTRQILIQEAKRLGLDREEPFRRSIQNYYEQTLLKNLTQKKMSEIRVSVSEEEIKTYYASMGRVYDLRVTTLSSEREANEAIKHFPSEKAETRILHMDEIPPEMVDAVLSLKVGDVSLKPVPCDKGFLVVKLEGYKNEAVPALDAVRGEIIKAVEEKKRRREMEQWLEGLKKNSLITISDSLLK